MYLARSRARCGSGSAAGSSWASWRRRWPRPPARRGDRRRHRRHRAGRGGAGRGADRVGRERAGAFALVDDARRRAAGRARGDCCASGSARPGGLRRGHPGSTTSNWPRPTTGFPGGPAPGRGGGDALTALYVSSRLALSALAQGAVCAARPTPPPSRPKPSTRASEKRGLAAAQQADRLRPDRDRRRPRPPSAPTGPGGRPTSPTSPRS